MFLDVFGSFLDQGTAGHAGHSFWTCHSPFLRVEHMGSFPNGSNMVFHWMPGKSFLVVILCYISTKLLGSVVGFVHELAIHGISNWRTQSKQVPSGNLT